MRPLPSARCPPVINITNATFYRHHPSSFAAAAPGPNGAAPVPNPALFNDLTFSIPAAAHPARHWSVIGPSLSGKTTFLQLLRGQHLCFPPPARSFPYLSSTAPGHNGTPGRAKTPTSAIRYVGFSHDSLSGAGPATTSAYLSARYESKREITDFSLRDFLLGNTELNALQRDPADAPDAALLQRVVHDLRLANLLDLPVAFLSNGQGRRARIARALLTGPEVLLLDEPFMGLDPPTVASLSPLLHRLADAASPRLVLTARPQDPIPDWISHIVYLRADCQVAAMGEKHTVLEHLRHHVRAVWNGSAPDDDKLPVQNLIQTGRILTASGIEGHALMGSDAVVPPTKCAADAAPASSLGPARTPVDTDRGEPLIEMDGARVQYRGNVVLGNWSQQVDGEPKEGLYWTVRRGQRWGVFGPNGSGKTTIVSLIGSDHPQTYSLPIKLFGRSRLPEPGSGQLPLTFWDIQSRIGHSSPEIHQYMPRSLTVRQVIENAWADTFRTKAKLDTAARARVDAVLRWFQPELDPSHRPEDAGSSNTGQADLAWSDHYMFGELSFSAQRVALFLRAIIKAPDVVVLDEACSGMDDGVRDRCLLFLEHGQTRTYAKRGATSTGATQGDRAGGRVVVESETSRSGEVVVPGLSSEQALVCISHVREEIPECIREWICLPEANTGNPARFGIAKGPLGSDEQSWKEIWGM